MCAFTFWAARLLLPRRLIRDVQYTCMRAVMQGRKREHDDRRFSDCPIKLFKMSL